MALQFYPAQNPHDFIFQGMTDEIPAGGFYLKTLEMMPRTSKLSEFTLICDTPVPVEIYVNGRLVVTHTPRGQRDVVLVPLAAPPATNYITAKNDVDPPVRLAIAATYMATYMWALAKEQYEVGGRVTEKYADFIASPWSAFIAEWLIPWRDILPDIRSLRALAVKMQTNTMYNESTLAGGVPDFVSGFTSSTPVIMAPRNPENWQPHLYPPQTHADDVATFDFNVWLPNLCLNRWSAFVTLINNMDQYEFARLHEEAITIQELESERYSQHLFDPTGPGCSIGGVLQAMGCMDAVVIAGIMELTANASFCVWTTPFDQIVELPGIGGEFFDASVTFDTAGHALADVTNVLSAGYATDQASAIALATEIRADYNAHDTDAGPTWHYAVGGSHQITAAIPSDLPTLITFCQDAQTQYAAHLADSAMHVPADTLYTLTYTITGTSTLADVQSFLNDFKNKYSGHQASGNFDTIYDIDHLTDYWVGTSLSKTFDGGSCMDSYSTTVLLPKDQECCVEGPDSKLLTTARLDQVIPSPVKPNHPVFGGDDPGLLLNPYFAVL